MGHSEASKRPRFPGCPLRGFQPSGSYPQATDNKSARIEAAEFGVPKGLLIRGLGKPCYEPSDHPNTTQISFSQRKRDDNNNTIRAFQGGVGRGGREEICAKRFFFMGSGKIPIYCTIPPTKTSQSRFLGRGCDEALFGEKKGFFSE